QALAKTDDARATMQHLNAWLSEHASRIQHVQRLLGEMKTANIADFPSLSVAMQEVRKLARIGAG
ncbi:MAG: hypothetical protein ACYDB9_00010, partial [Gammaproteobacteria bacterium]